LTLRTEVLEEHHQLQLEEDDRVHRRPAASGVQRGYELPHERKVERGFQAAVKVALWDEVLKREVVG
jgi:hypothetical protein